MNYIEKKRDVYETCIETLHEKYGREVLRGKTCLETLHEKNGREVLPIRGV